MMDNAFAEKQERERKKQGKWLRLYISTQCCTQDKVYTLEFAFLYFILTLYKTTE